MVVWFLTQATIAYRQVSADTRSLLDDQLAQIARLAAQTVNGSEIQSRGDEDIAVSVWGADRKLKFSTARGAPAAAGGGGFSEVLRCSPSRTVFILDLRLAGGTLPWQRRSTSGMTRRRPPPSAAFLLPWGYWCRYWRSSWRW